MQKEEGVAIRQNLGRCMRKRHNKAQHAKRREVVQPTSANPRLELYSISCRTTV